MTRAERSAFARRLEDRLGARLSHRERILVDAHLEAPRGLAACIVDPVEAAVVALREGHAERTAREASHRPGEPPCLRCGHGVRHFLAHCPRGPRKSH